jgi:hypothetical protein
MQCQKCGTTKPPLHYHIITYVPLQYTILCKSCHNEEHGLGLKLIEIFKEHTPTVLSRFQNGKYIRNYIITKKPNPPQLTETDLGIYTERLQQRYPNEGFYLRKLTWKNKTLHVLAKRKNHHTQGRIPLYFDLENQKFYIDKKDLQQNEKLANYLIMVVLGSLGISQSKYTHEIRRETSEG